MKKILVLVPFLLITSFSLAEENSNTKEVIINGEKRIIYVAGTDRWNNKDFAYEIVKGTAIGVSSGVVAGAVGGSVTLPVVGTVSGAVGGGITGAVSGAVGGAVEYIVDEIAGKH